MRIFKNPNYNFVRWRRHALVLSSVVIGAGIVMVVMRGGLPLGVDFSGGTIVVLHFEQSVTEQALRAALADVPGEKIVQRYGDASANEILVRLPLQGPEDGADLDEGATAIVAATEAAGMGPFEVISTDLVGPVIGQDLQRKGIYATITALLGIAAYIAVRFNFAFAVGALGAVFHDVLVTLVFLMFFGYDLSLNVIAAILTITGYSVNDTIVIFDRARENRRLMRRESTEHLINTSVNQTLTRTVITSGTTSFTVLALFLFGGEVLEGFSFAMLVGIISGTYSTVFIASSIAIMMRPGVRRATTAAAQPDAAGRKKAGSRVRAS